MRKLACVILFFSLFAPLACDRDNSATVPATNAAQVQQQFAQVIDTLTKAQQHQADMIAAHHVKQWPEPPAMEIDPGHDYSATISTPKGDIVIHLDSIDAPMTVNSFVFLARQHFYDGITFHRVESTLIQGGDPLGNGTGGPGYSLPDETYNAVHFDVGKVAMANSGPNTSGSQFFICLTPSEMWREWQGKYTIFGQVTKGLDIAKSIQVGDIMKTVTITESATTEPTTAP